MKVYSITEVAAWLTREFGEYVPASRVSAAVRRLITAGELEERRASRQYILSEADLTVLASEFGVAAEPGDGGAPDAVEGRLDLPEQPTAGCSAEE